MYFVYGSMYINCNKSVKFIANTAQIQGGAIYLELGVHSSIIVNDSANLFFLTTLHFKEVLFMSYHHHLQLKLDINRVLIL